MTLRVGTRASLLARIQANTVIQRLHAEGVDAEAVPLSTRGDRSRLAETSAPMLDNL